MKHKISIMDIAKFVKESKALSKKDEGFSLDIEELKEILEEESELMADEGVAYNIFTDIFDVIDEDDIEMYSKEVKSVVKKFMEFIDGIEEDELENLDEMIEIDMTQDEGDEKKSKKDKKEKKDKKGKKEKSADLTTTFEKAFEFFSHISDLQETGDIMIDEDLLSEKPTESTIVDIIKSIMTELDDDDISEINKENIDFYNEFNGQDFTVAPPAKKEEVKEKKKDKKAPKENKKKDIEKEEDFEAEPIKEDPLDDDGLVLKLLGSQEALKPIDGSRTVGSSEVKTSECCGACASNEKVLVLKGDTAMIDAITKMLEVISK